MPPRVALVTGVSRYLGGHLAALLARDDRVERVIGVDTLSPRGSQLAQLGRTEFVRADIRNPLIAKVVASAEVDTVVHTGVVDSPRAAGGRSAMKEINVIGTMQLLAACQKSPNMRRLVIRSSSAVYGSSAKDPALFTEDMQPRRTGGGYGKDAIEVEGYVRGFGRRRPDVTVTVLRLASVIGPRIDTPLTRYFSFPVVPTALGFDPRLQLCHEDDAVEVLRRSTVEHHPGVFNVGGAGVLLLSQALRRSGRAAVAVPSPALDAVSGVMRRVGLVDFSPEQLSFLLHGRVLDTSRLAAEYGGEVLRYTTASAFHDFVAGRNVRAVVPTGALTRVERGLSGLLSALPQGGRAVDA